MSLNLAQFPLPLPFSLPLNFEYGHDGSEVSQQSSTTAFNTGINQRDVFRGEKVCVVCGIDVTRQAHIIPKVENETWSECRHRGYVPQFAKSVEHEPRNGMLLCPNHYIFFTKYAFFLRWIPEIRKFVLINFSRISWLEPYHGRAVFLKFQDRHVPFPAIFLLHEARVRARYPFLHDRPLDLPIMWQDIFGPHVDEHGNLLPDAGNTAPPSTAPDPQGSSSILPTNRGPGNRHAPMDGGPTIDVSWNSEQIMKVLTSSRQLPTWKACIIEGTSWEGTAEENMAKYHQIMEI